MEQLLDAEAPDERRRDWRSMIDDIDTGKNILSSLCLVRIVFISAKNTLPLSMKPLALSLFYLDCGVLVRVKAFRDHQASLGPNYQHDKVP